MTIHPILYNERVHEYDTEARHYANTYLAAMNIVRDLAESDPYDMLCDWFCTFCGQSADKAATVVHLPNCLWLKAKQLVGEQ